MANNNKNFNTATGDLGLDTGFGLTSTQVSEGLKCSQFNTGNRCLICGNTAQYSLIAKEPKYNTAEIQNNGFICGHCLNINNNINKEHYGIRELK